MSFSENVKIEILDQLISKKCCMQARNIGELLVAGNKVDVKLIKHLIQNNCCLSSILQGVFLEAGYVNDPNNSYYAQFILPNKPVANICSRILSTLGISHKQTCNINKMENVFKLYIKGANQIILLLNALKATSAYLEFENIRVKKSVANDVNRVVNCEIANISKTISSAVEQLKAVELIYQNKQEFDKLKPELKEACELRKNYPEASLDELRKYATNTVSKSGMYHRLEKIKKIAKEL